MSDRVSAPYLFRRVAARAGVGAWRHRGAVLMGVLASAALGGYLTLTSAGGTPLALGALAASRSTAAGDCADTAMAAIADKSPTAAQRAYQCMDAGFQQRVSEQAFTQQIQSQSLPNVQNVDRVSDYHPPAGGTMVYYAVNTSGQTVGYIVYLGQNGKVLRIE
jgi:hypothetical protein